MSMDPHTTVYNSQKTTHKVHLILVSRKLQTDYDRHGVHEIGVRLLCRLYVSTLFIFKMGLNLGAMGFCCQTMSTVD